MDIRAIAAKVKYFLEHLDYLLFQQINPLARAAGVNILFDLAPTYAEIVPGTIDQGLPKGLDPAFSLANFENNSLVRQVALKWNTLYPSLVQMDSELEKLGLQLVKGGVAMYDPGEEMGCV